MDVKHVFFAEYTDCSLSPHAGMLVEFGKFGCPVEELQPDSEVAEYMMAYGEELVDCFARHLDVELDNIVPGFEILTATRDIDAQFGFVGEGTICGVIFKHQGFWQGEEFIQLEWNFSAQNDHPSFPTIPHDSRFVIEIEGTPSIRTAIDFVPSLAKDYVRKPDDIQAAWHSTAASAFRSIPFVCKAPPGIIEPPYVWGAWSPRWK